MQIIINIISLLVLLGGVVYCAFKYRKAYDKWHTAWRYGQERGPEPKFPIKTAVAFALAAFIVFGANQCYQIIPTGSSGVEVTAGQVSEKSITSGIAFKIPFIQDIRLVNNKIQETELFKNDGKIWGESSDQIEVYIADVVVQYRISPERSAWIVANVTDYERQLVNERIVSAPFKDATNKLEAIDVTKRDKVEPLAKEKLQTALDDIYGEGTVTIVAVHIGDMNFLAEYNDALAKKNLARQEYEAQQVTNQTNIERADAEAQARVKAAEGAAQEQLTKANAQAEAEKIIASGKAEANRILSDSITDNTLKSDFYEKWNGELPKAVGEGFSVYDIVGGSTTAASAE